MKRSSTPRFLTVIAAVCIALFAVGAFAQFQTGNIYGKVQAKDGRPDATDSWSKDL